MRTAFPILALHSGDPFNRYWIHDIRLPPLQWGNTTD